MRPSRRKLALVLVVGLAVLAFLGYSVTVGTVRYYHPGNGAMRRVVRLSLSLTDTWSVKLMTLSDTVVPTRVSDYLVGRSLPRPEDDGWVGMGATCRSLLAKVIACAPAPLVMSDLEYELFESSYRPFLSDAEYRALLKLSLSQDHQRDGLGLVQHEFLETLEKAQTPDAKRALLKEKLGPLWQPYN